MSSCKMFKYLLHSNYSIWDLFDLLGKMDYQEKYLFKLKCNKRKKLQTS